MQYKALMPASSRKTPLIWDDLLYLYQHNFCLRAVENKEAAYREDDVGGRGDAISLSTFAYPGAPCESKIFHYLQKRNYLPQGDIESSYSMVCTWLAHDLFKSEEFSKERDELITRMHEGITLLVTQAFEYSQKPGFLLLRFDDNMFPYEIGDRYPLGKIGKRNFTGNAVRSIIVERNGHWDVDSAIDAIVSGIRGLRLRYVDDQKWIQQNANVSDTNSGEYLEWEKQQSAYEAEMKKYIAEKEKLENEAGSVSVCPRGCTLF